MEKIKRILKFGMRLEKQGENFYEYYRDVVTNKGTKELFDDLAKMERDHYNLLEKKYDELNTKDDLKVISWVVDDREYFDSPKIFGQAADLVPTENEDTQISDLAIMRMAYIIEGDFCEFYKNAAENVENEEVKKFLLQLSEWENGHKEIFQKEYRKLLKEDWEDMENYLALD
ncbi:ferritin family protein [Irregularibacter muris]|uniref:Ferritin family protein n=1 Tax=Irregularibacter muris TaxID=1796619 RepID=A0AAE3KYV9_9FIRM|nr:ferritin family protein [Irregularibacter muris]MCR1897676.1 ferritin family protein [Irregularibacter muris]